jgi:hypothetical protein
MFVLLHLDPSEILKWKLLGIPVIIIWVNPDGKDTSNNALWRSAHLASSRSGRLRIPEKAVLSSKGTARNFKTLMTDAWKPNLVRLNHQTLFPNKVREIKDQAWDYYRQWRDQGSTSPVFQNVEITLKGWRHMTRQSLPQKAVIHKLSLLRLARELIETSQKSKCVRVLNNPEGDGRKRELHSLKGVSMSKHQADVEIEVILEVEKLFGRIRRVSFLSVKERKGWSD